jgi:hypothetical protein
MLWKARSLTLKNSPICVLHKSTESQSNVFTPYSCHPNDAHSGEKKKASDFLANRFKKEKGVRGSRKLWGTKSCRLSH